MNDRFTADRGLVCYRCGSALAALTLPLSRLDQCPSCSVDLHVCRMCVHYAPSAPDACKEDDAIEVQEKTRANFCDYFKPDPDAFEGSELKAEIKARSQLDALFGDESADAKTQDAADDPLRQQAEDLFK